MSARPAPPGDSLEEIFFTAGDQVYYFRGGKWRAGRVEGKGGTSDESPRYTIRDLANGEAYLIADCDIRKKAAES